MAEFKIPETITVHLGTPSNKSAKNVTVPFTDYIKNVASSEIYPTWPENSLMANIYAIISFALNRIYTEHYRAKGYDFDITNSTQYDQAFVNGRDVFSNISNLVDDMFNDYVIKQGQVQPYFTQYCDGKSVTCKGLSQWGTVPLAKQGKTPYEILQYYYGKDIDLVKNAPVAANIPSYPGYPLKLGSSGNDVVTIQKQLNRISANYPSIPVVSIDNGIFEAQTQAAVKQFQKIFNLTQDGIVGKSTWYKIKSIYSGVKKLSELYSEGITISEAEQLYPSVLKQGDTGSPVSILQYYLAFVGFFNSALPVIKVDGIFGPQTYNAVKDFQKLYGLQVDGIVGKETWNTLMSAYYGIINALPAEYKSYSSLLYPGYIITVGAQGKVVEQIQTFINTIAKNDKNIPSVTVDGYYGSQTEKAVKAIQKEQGIIETGQVGPLTWNAIVNLYNEYRAL